MLTRRDFVKQSLAGLGTLPLASSVPLFIPRSLSAADPKSPDRRILVVIELDGGNDGINTVIPYSDDGYTRHRNVLRIAEDRLIKLDDQVGLHPALRSMADLWETGRLSIVQGVGYPNPNRSHFQSMEIWHTANPGAQQRNGLGWVGRGLDQAQPLPEGLSAMNVGPQELPLALRGRRARASNIYRLDQFSLPKAPQTLVLPNSAIAPAIAGSHDDLHQFVYRTASDVRRTAEQLEDVAQRDAATEQYPATALARHLRLTARLIRADFGVRVFYTQQSGYDTHAGQLPQHAALLQELGDALKAFFADLERAGLADRVLVLAFSEFGRRVQENGSQGTDHGTAGPVFLAGPAVQGALVGQTPLLMDLDNGDLKMSIDFRQVYATLLEKWIGVPSDPVLGNHFDPLPLLSEVA